MSLERVKIICITSEFRSQAGEDKYEELKSLCQYANNRFSAPVVLFGGAIRDSYIGQRAPNDYDFAVCTSETEITDTEINKTFSRDTRYRQEKVFNGKIISFDFSLFTESFASAAQQQIILADAVVNSVAMDASGEVLALDGFLHDADKKLYRLRPNLSKKREPESMERFARFKQKDPSWNFAH